MAKKSAPKKAPAKKSTAKKSAPKKSSPKAKASAAKKTENVEQVKSEVTNTIRVTLKNVRIVHEEEIKGKLVGMFMQNLLDEGNAINVTIADGTYVGVAKVHNEDTPKQKFTFIDFSVQQFIG